MKILVWLFIFIMYRGEEKKRKKNSYVLALNGSYLMLWTLLGLGCDRIYFSFSSCVFGTNDGKVEGKKMTNYYYALNVI